MNKVPEQPKWRKIRTAPKDGKRILIVEGSCVTAASWIVDSTFSGGAGWTDGTVADWGMQYYAQYRPTHWMPLPPLPRASDFEK